MAEDRAEQPTTLEFVSAPQYSAAAVPPMPSSSSSAAAAGVGAGGAAAAPVAGSPASGLMRADANSRPGRIAEFMSSRGYGWLLETDDDDEADREDDGRHQSLLYAHVVAVLPRDRLAASRCFLAFYFVF
jgi:hypothetical protein